MKAGIKVLKKQKINKLKLFISSFLVLVMYYSCTNNNHYDSSELQKEIVDERNDSSVWKRKYFPDSRMILNEGEYINGDTSSGIFRQYNLNGTLDWEAVYEHGEIHGIVRSYHEGYKKNFLHKEGTVLNDKQVGTWKYFYPNGNPKGVEIYDSSGSVKYGVYFAPDGKFEREEFYE